MDVFYTGIACQHSWDTWRSFSQEVGLSETETYTWAKMTAKCPMNADMQYRCKTHPCDHCNPHKSILCSKSHGVTLLSSFELFAQLRKGEFSVRSCGSVYRWHIGIKSLYCVRQYSRHPEKPYMCYRHSSCDRVRAISKDRGFFLTFSICVFSFFWTHHICIYTVSKQYISSCQ